MREPAGTRRYRPDTESYTSVETMAEKSDSVSEVTSWPSTTGICMPALSWYGERGGRRCAAAYCGARAKPERPQKSALRPVASRATHVGSPGCGSSPNGYGDWKPKGGGAETGGVLAGGTSSACGV